MSTGSQDVVKKLKMATGSRDLEKFHSKSGLTQIFIKKLKMATGSRDLEKFHSKSGLTQIFIKKLKMATGSRDLEKYHSKSGLSQISNKNGNRFKEKPQLKKRRAAVRELCSTVARLSPLSRGPCKKG